MCKPTLGRLPDRPRLRRPPSPARRRPPLPPARVPTRLRPHEITNLFYPSTGVKKVLKRSDVAHNFSALFL